MKNLQDQLNSALNESRTQNRQIGDYFKKWIMDLQSMDDARAFLDTIKTAVTDAVVERNRYFKEPEEREVIEYIVDHLWVDLKR